MTRAKPKRRVAIQMDPIERINLLKEATFLLGLEAQARGYELWYYTPDKLAYQDGKITATGHRLTLSAKPPHFNLGDVETIDLKKMDVILLRQDPPFDMSYITTTYFLERLHPKPFVVNNPASVRDNPEKWFPTEFARFMPPTLITADPTQIKEFHQTHQDIVIKPLYGHAGRAVFHVTPSDPNLPSLLETLFSASREPLVIQKFLPEMRDKEVRIIFIDGEFSGILGRLPAKGETRASFLVGAQYIKTKPTKRHLEIIKALGPILKKRGLLFTGIDVIGDYLTEINITSPGSLVGMTKIYGKKLEVDMWNAIERYLP